MTESSHETPLSFRQNPYCFSASAFPTLPWHASTYTSQQHVLMSKLMPSCRGRGEYGDNCGGAAYLPPDLLSRAWSSPYVQNGLDACSLRLTQPSIIAGEPKQVALKRTVRSDVQHRLRSTIWAMQYPAHGCFSALLSLQGCVVRVDGAALHADEKVP